MTLKQYDEKLKKLISRFDNGDKKAVREIKRVQRSFMANVLSEYSKKVDSAEKAVICEMLDFAVNEAKYSSTNYYFEDELEFAKKVKEIIWNEIGDYLAEEPELVIYETYCKIHCKFSYYYLPEWEGWYEQ